LPRGFAARNDGKTGCSPRLASLRASDRRGRTIRVKTALLGVDSPIGLTVLRELGQHGVPVLGVGKQGSIGAASRHASAFAVRPPGAIAEWLPALVEAHGIGAVMAVSEGDLVQLATLKHALRGVTIAVPDPEPLALVLDKTRTLEAAQAVGIAVPQSWQPLVGEDHTARAAALAYPVAIKWADPIAAGPLLGAAGLALEKVEYAMDAPGLLAILARYDALQQWPLVQEWCAGHGLGQMLYMAGGRATLRFQHRRLREWPASGGVSTYCEAVPLDQHAALMERSEALLASIGWEGAAMVEYRHDSVTGRSVLMEINGRFWGSIPLAHHCGAQFGWETYRRQVLGETADETPALKPGRARYMVPDTKHLVAELRDPAVTVAAKARLVASFVGGLFDPRTGYYVWSASDPGPLFADLKAMAAKALQRDSAPPAA
jgi:predicted ATP-grasp superfamily ATP-dependent carboligase